MSLSHVTYHFGESSLLQPWVCWFETCYLSEERRKKEKKEIERKKTFLESWSMDSSSWTKSIQTGPLNYQPPQISFTTSPSYLTWIPTGLQSTPLSSRWPLQPRLALQDAKPSDITRDQLQFITSYSPSGTVALRKERVRFVELSFLNYPMGSLGRKKCQYILRKGYM